LIEAWQLVDMQVRVQRVGEDRWHLARVVAVVLDADVALLTVDDSDSMSDGVDEDEDEDSLETPVEEEVEEEEEEDWGEQEAEEDSSDGSGASDTEDWFGSSSFWSGLQQVQFGELPELRVRP
jgi:hypothetical protein